MTNTEESQCNVTQHDAVLVGCILILYNNDSCEKLHELVVNWLLFSAHTP